MKGKEDKTLKPMNDSTGQRKVILVVEDNAVIRKLYSAILQEEGYLVTGAADGLEATRLVAEMPVLDLVVSDFRMPRMNGLELARWFQANRPSVTFLLLSASPDLVEATGTAMPSIICVGKPPHVDDLLAAVAKAIER